MLYQLKIDDKIVRDRLIQAPHADAEFKFINEGNLVGNILKLYAELDPLACFAEWGCEERKVIKKARQNGNVLTVDGKPYDFAREFNISTTQERCYYYKRINPTRNNEINNEEPYWILAPAVEPGYWLVCDTKRSREYLADIIAICENGFFTRYGIESVQLTERP